jgi:aminodeoxyfutalosine deaminase
MATDTSTTTYRAAWILPISAPPIRDGWIATRDGRIAGLGAGPVRATRGAVVDLGDVAVLPALANAHTHLELSWLRGRIAPSDSFLSWISAMMRERLTSADGRRIDTVRAATAAALAEMRSSGTGLAGDISNGLEHLDLLGPSGLAGVVFHEIVKFRAPEPALTVADAESRIASAMPGPGWRMALAPHAPYSVSPAVFDALRQARGPGGVRPMSVHIAESPEEVEFISRGSGGWRDLLKRLGSWDDEWRAPGCSPVAYLDRLGFWGPRTLAVHGVQASDEDLRLLAVRGATLVTCPRSNVHVGVGDPPASRFFASGVPIAIGTDSLSSVEDLNLFTDVAALHRLAPDVAPSRLLESATLTGARALGLEGEFGSLQPGARSAIISVDVPAGAPNVEEYLVSGITPAAVRWVETDASC